VDFPLHDSVVAPLHLAPEAPPSKQRARGFSGPSRRARPESPGINSPRGDPQPLSSRNPSDTEQRVRAARSGDRTALNDLLTCYLPWVRQTVALRLRRSLREWCEFDDIVQESLLDAFRSLGAFVEHEGSFANWLAGIVLNNIRDAARKSARQCRNPDRVEQRLDGSPSGSAPGIASRDASPSQLAQAQELEDRVERAMLALSDAHREILVLRDRCNLQYAEIATQLGFKNEDTARALHHRALRKLEAAL
jgi:RNA polymerase sigma-70 factor (ECF subfamily)